MCLNCGSLPVLHLGYGRSLIRRVVRILLLGKFGWGYRKKSVGGRCYESFGLLGFIFALSIGSWRICAFAHLACYNMGEYISLLGSARLAGRRHTLDGAGKQRNVVLPVWLKAKRLRLSTSMFNL